VDKPARQRRAGRIRWLVEPQLKIAITLHTSKAQDLPTTSAPRLDRRGSDDIIPQAIGSNTATIKRWYASHTKEPPRFYGGGILKSSPQSNINDWYEIPGFIWMDTSTDWFRQHGLDSSQASSFHVSVYVIVSHPHDGGWTRNRETGMSNQTPAGPFLGAAL
jgi:hypothetical protein